MDVTLVSCEPSGMIDAPQEPSSAVSVCAVLLPSSEVVAACKALPACSPYGKVVLSCEVLFVLLSVTVSKIRDMNLAIVKAETLL